MAENDFRNQIFRLTLAEIDAIEDDLRLYQQGYTFYYAVDTYDFVNFFMPYLNKLNFGKEKINLLAQEAICYESFFTKPDSSSIILLDEYKKELLQVKDLFFEKVKYATELRDNKLDLAREILGMIESGADLESVINKNFELFLLSLILSKRTSSINGISFLQFLKKRIHIDFFETGSPEFDDYAIQTIKKEIDGVLTDDIYDQFIDHSITQLRKLDESKLHKYLENTYLDIEAVQHLLTANQAVSGSDKFSKNIFYYFSSTPYKSKLIFDIILRRHKPKFPFHSIFSHPATSLLRNNFQVFLLTALQREYSGSLDTAINILARLKEYILINTTADSGLPLPEGINSLLEKLGSKVENHFYRGLLSNYQETLQSILTERNKGDEEHRIMLEFKEFLKNEKEDNIVQDLHYDISKLGQISLLKNALQGRVKEISGVKVKFGSDIIKFNFHHLPFLPFLYDQEMHNRYYSLYLFLQSISEIENEDDNNEQFILDYLDQLGHSQADNFKKRSYDFLILAYVDLLSVTKNHATDNGGMEQTLIEALEKRLHVTERAERIRKKKTPRKNDGPDTSLFKETSYLLVWLYRRNLMFDKIAQLEDKWKNLEMQDPRFQHGIGLAAISQYYNGNKSEDWLIRKSISSLSASLHQYERTHKTIRSEVLAWLLLKNIIAVCNSVCDAYMLLFDLDHKDQHIDMGRKSMAKMREYMDKHEEYFDNLPVPIMTEAQLETYESEISLNSGNIFIAKKKLEQARRNYKKATAKKSLMDPQFSEKVNLKILELSRKMGISQDL